MSSQNLIAHSPRWPRIKDSLVSPAFWYRVANGTTEDITDSLGQGPDVTLLGTLTNVHDNYFTGVSDPGPWWTFPGSDANYVRTLGDAVLDELGRLDNFNGQIIIAFQAFAADHSPAGSFVWMSYGEAETAGGWNIGVQAAGHSFSIFQVGGSNQAATASLPAGLDGTAVTFTVEIDCSSKTEIVYTLFVNGEERGGDSVAATMAQRTPIHETKGMCLFARNLTSANPDRKLTFGVRLSRFFMMKRTTRDSLLPGQVAAEFAADPHSIPECLEGK